ncbi:uncharacterized protein [Arachis hypogaea]|uniref:uncharacterized protein n=1 Tax=Arachis hypogaea TaxID=3818 RepID=UPI000DECA268|nr:uncharacterized protein DS421_16g546910 [Arachis hypogaea]
MRERGKAGSVTTVVPCSMPSPPLFCHKRRMCEGGNRIARVLSHGERRRTSNLSPPVRPPPNHAAVREAFSITAAEGRHRSHCSTSVILLFPVVAEPLKPLATVRAAAD